MIEMVNAADFEKASTRDKLSTVPDGLTEQIRKANKKMEIRVGDVLKLYPRENESNAKFSNRTSSAFRALGFAVSIRCRGNMGHALVKILEVPQFNG